MATVLVPALLIATAIGLLFAIGGYLTVQVSLRWRRHAAQGCPPISVLRPLKGCDDGLYENLVALARQRYPEFEIICGAADADDPALAVAARVQSEYPEVAITIVSGAAGSGHNPKVANLQQLVRHARHAHWLISDSNVRPRPDYLRAMAAELSDPKVGLVHSILTGVGEKSLGAGLENLHLNTWLAASVNTAAVLFDHPCVVGKSMLFHRDDLDHAGGLDGVRDILAEDYVLGQRFTQIGRRVALSPHPLPVVCARRSVRQFASRHLRWNQMRRHISPLTYLAEPLLNPAPLLFIVAALAHTGALADALPAAVVAWLASAAPVAIALKYAGDALTAYSLRGRLPSPLIMAMAPAKDLLLLALWVVAGFHRTVVWRGNRMRISAGSEVHALPAGRGRWGARAASVWRPTRTLGRLFWIAPRGLWRVLRRRAVTTAGSFEELP